MGPSDWTWKSKFPTSCRTCNQSCNRKGNVRFQSTSTHYFEITNNILFQRAKLWWKKISKLPLLLYWNKYYNFNKSKIHFLWRKLASWFSSFRSISKRELTRFWRLTIKIFLGHRVDSLWQSKEVYGPYYGLTSVNIHR